MNSFETGKSLFWLCVCVFLLMCVSFFHWPVNGPITEDVSTIKGKGGGPGPSLERENEDRFSCDRNRLSKRVCVSERERDRKRGKWVCLHIPAGPLLWRLCTSSNREKNLNAHANVRQHIQLTLVQIRNDQAIRSHFNRQFCILSCRYEACVKHGRLHTNLVLPKNFFVIRQCSCRFPNDKWRNTFVVQLKAPFCSSKLLSVKMSFGRH